MTTVKPIPPGSTPGGGTGNGAAATTTRTETSPTEIAPAARPEASPARDTKAESAPTQTSGETQAQGRTDEGAAPDATKTESKETQPAGDDLLDSEFLTEDDKKEFGEAINQLPPGARKAARRFLDKKFAEASRAREFLGYFQTSEGARTATLQLARKLGLEVRDPQATVTEDAKGRAVAAVRAELSTALGEETANRLLNTLQPLLSVVTDEAVRPIKQHMDETLAREAESDVKEAMDSFRKRYPDHAKFEKRMAELGQKFKVEPGSMTHAEYLDHLYHLASREDRETNVEAEAARKVTERMTAAASEAGAVSSPTSGVAAQRVAPVTGEKISLREAFRRAKAGIPPPS